MQQQRSFNVAGWPQVLSLRSLRWTGTLRRRSISQESIALGLVFVACAALYVWTAGSSTSLSLHGGLGDRYNLLATAFLHLHVSIGPAPAAITHLANPYDPSLNGMHLLGANDAKSINDDVMYHGKLYFLWGPAPALVLLVPLHLVGFEPSASLTCAFFGVVGLGFALATLRVIIRQIGGAPLWMCTLAGLALALSSVVPFILRNPTVTTDTLAGGYCFTMVAVWVATAALIDREASWWRLVLMSLCFGLAAGSRPSLVLSACLLIPVYLALRSSWTRPGLLLALGLPLAICIALLLAYNQARYGQPLEIGSRYQLSALNSPTAPLGQVSYVFPGIRAYMLNPPRPRILFPFLAISAPNIVAPAGLANPEPTGGLLPMVPVAVLLVALPWVWRRRPVLLGRLAMPLLMLAAVGLAIPLIASFELFAPTQRYEVEFCTLFALGALAVWISLTTVSHRRLGLLLRVCGGLLVLWGCMAGLAISLVGSGNVLATKDPQTWRKLEDISAPISTVIANVVGRPVLAQIVAREMVEAPPAGDASLDVGATEFTLAPSEEAGLTIVSPGSRKATLSALVEHQPGARGVQIAGSDGVHRYALPQEGGTITVPIQLKSGLNRLRLGAVMASGGSSGSTAPILLVKDMTIASG